MTQGERQVVNFKVGLYLEWFSPHILSRKLRGACVKTVMLWPTTVHNWQNSHVVRSFRGTRPSKSCPIKFKPQFIFSDIRILWAEEKCCKPLGYF
jgi:uncharacterized protein YeaC (DUF1315 family)